MKGVIFQGRAWRELPLFSQKLPGFKRFRKSMPKISQNFQNFFIKNILFNKKKTFAKSQTLAPTTSCSSGKTVYELCLYGTSPCPYPQSSRDAQPVFDGRGSSFVGPQSGGYQEDDRRPDVINFHRVPRKSFVDFTGFASQNSAFS